MQRKLHNLTKCPLLISKYLFFVFLISFLVVSCSDENAKIDRFALVNRHNVRVNAFDSLSSLTVGNGAFAFAVDATGLQTFQEIYENGICLGTMSEWGWHSFPNTEGYLREEAFNYYKVEGREIPYAVQPKEEGRKKAASDYFRVNPHRLQLAGIGFEFRDGVKPEQISAISQELNLWEGTIRSEFQVKNDIYRVETCCHPSRDLIGVSFKTENKGEQVDGINIRFPFPTGGHVDGAANWNNIDGHFSEIVEKEPQSAVFRHTIDSTTYFLKINWTGNAELVQKQPHYFAIKPENLHDFSFSFEFSPDNNFAASKDVASIQSESENSWKDYWESGGIVDFSETTDPRAVELERRVILSQYLIRAQEAGHYPPQETGLTFNSWYGKFHLEMHWWHAAHWTYWNHPELLEKSLDYYFKILGKAKHKAVLQGYEGVRWPKMTDNAGNDSPSNVGEFLIWQQPHIIYFAEQLYQSHPDEATLERYLPLIQSTADFMADFARWDEENKRFILGPPLIPAQESLEKEKTFNPPFELAYWHWGLTTAQSWLNRLNLPSNQEWQNVIDNLSLLPQKDGLYLAAESAPDSYENEDYYSDHPMILGTFGILPQTLPLDTGIMSQTFDYIERHWNWDRTWGWDYPMAAMCATRLGKPEQAIDLLLKDVLKNTYLPNGHNYQGERLRIYLPGNGGLLTAVAMMCAGFEGNATKNPGFPEDWKVKWENIDPLF
ncbi:hypothetical protein [Maribellus sediminis]|uniref:hypothetical protein n=1 Tax=Maribellus sediminis TaxID=2696285 RepID=UPI00197D74FB|nr:hypothetical protein [Maribellus sediminis]